MSAVNQGRPISYSDGDLALSGHFYSAEGPAKGAMLIYPTIAGPNAPMFRRAEMLAALGYHAFIADYYGQPEESFDDRDALFAAGRALMADTSMFRERLTAALKAFQSLDEVDGLPMAMIGYCMGGKAICEMARSGVDLACGVGFHGILSTDKAADKGAVKTPLLICHGHDDPLVPPEQVRGFQEEMDAAGADWMIHIYSGTRHSFTDPEADRSPNEASAYNAAADRMSWTAMREFLDMHMG